MKRWRTLSILSLLTLVGLVAVRPAAAASHVSEASFTVPAGETITLEVSAYCLEFGEPFPESVSLSASKAPINARRVMKAAAQSGAIDDDVLQTQLAIWRAVEGDWSIDEDDEDFELAVALFEASGAQNTAPLDAQGSPLNAALRDDSLDVEVVDWEALDAEQIDEDDEPYYGRATLEISNSGDEDLELYVPLGLILEAEDEDEQDMGIAAVEGHASMTTDDEEDEEEESSTDEDTESDEGDDEDVDDADEDMDDEEAVKDSSTDDPDELPVTGLPGVPDTLLAMILGAIVLSAGLVLRRA